LAFFSWRSRRPLLSTLLLLLALSSSWLLLCHHGGFDLIFGGILAVLEAVLDGQMDERMR
jgi:hypothetical protein